MNITSRGDEIKMGEDMYKLLVICDEKFDNIKLTRGKLYKVFNIFYWDEELKVEYKYKSKRIKKTSQSIIVIELFDDNNDPDMLELDLNSENSVIVFKNHHELSRKLETFKLHKWISDTEYEDYKKTYNEYSKKNKKDNGQL